MIVCKIKLLVIESIIKYIITLGCKITLGLIIVCMII